MHKRIISAFLAFILCISNININSMAMELNTDASEAINANVDKDINADVNEAANADEGKAINNIDASEELSIDVDDDTNANKDKDANADVDDDTNANKDKDTNANTDEDTNTDTDQDQDTDLDPDNQDALPDADAMSEVSDASSEVSDILSVISSEVSDISSETPSYSMTQNFLADTEAPYDGNYLLAANISTNVSGQAEAVGTLPTVSEASYNDDDSNPVFSVDGAGSPVFSVYDAVNPILPADDSENYIFLPDNPDVYDFDGDGRGLIEPDSFLPELVIDENAAEYQASEEASPAEYYVGYERSFALNTTADSQYNSVDCICAAVSEYCTVWVPVNDPIYEADAERMKEYMSTLAAEFDKQFPKMTTMFGSKETVDRVYGDNDGKTALLCYDINGNGVGVGSYTAGYFFGADLNISAYKNSTGNKIDCLHIDSWQGMNRNTSTNTLNPIYGKRTMVHELQHMINYSICRDNETKLVKLTIPTYLNEAYSEAAAHLCYGKADNRISNYNSYSYIDSGKVSLLDWGGYHKLSNYALSYLFSQYIRTQYAQGGANGETIYKDTMNALTEGKSLFDVIAQKLEVTSGELLFNFRAALFLKNAEGAYGFGGEEWAESIKSKSTSAVADMQLAPGAAVVIPMSGSFEPSDAGENICFAGMYSDITEDDIEVAISGETHITEEKGSVQLTASVSPKSVSQSVIFSLLNPEDGVYADVSASGLVSAKSNGIVTVRAASVYNPSKYADITITITGQQAVGIEQNTSLEYGGIRVFYTVKEPAGAVLYYTVNGQEPGLNSEEVPKDGILFDAAGSYTLKVLGHDPEGIYKDVYVEDEVTVEQVQEPVITSEMAETDEVGAQRVSIQAQDGAEIYYTTDGSLPSMENGTRYEAPFIIDALGSTVVKAAAIKEGAVPSETSSYEVTVYSAIVMVQSRTPVQGGINVNYTLMGPPGSAMYYTVDGNTPSTDSAPLDENGILFDMAGKHTLKILGHDSSGVYKDRYAEDVIVVEKAEAPVISSRTEIAGIGTQRVTIQAQDGAEIYYAVNLDDEAAWHKYEGSFIIDTLGTTTVSAFSLTKGAAASDVASEDVVVKYSYELMQESEKAPYMTQVSFTLNKKAAGGTDFLILPIMDNKILHAELTDMSDDFLLQRMGGNGWQISLINKELAKKTYQGRLRIVSQGVDNAGYVDTLNIKIKVVDAAPKISLGTVTVNTAEPSMGCPLNVASKSGKVEVLGIENAGSAGFTDNFELRNGALYLKKAWDDLTKTPAGKPVLSGRLKVQVEGWEPQYVALNVKAVNKAPKLVPSVSAIKLNYNKLKADKSFEFTLNTKVGVNEAVLENIEAVSLDEAGGAAYKKAVELINDIYCADGRNILVYIKDAKPGTYTLPLLVSAGAGENAFCNARCNVKITIEKETAAPATTLSASKVTLNRKTSGEKAYISVKSVTQYNMELTDIQCEYAGVTDTVNESCGVSLSYNKAYNRLEAQITGEPSVNSYKFICTPVYNETVEQNKTLAVTVNVTDKAPALSVRAKGSIDVLNRNSSLLVYTIKKSNFTDEIESVEFERASKLTASVLDASQFFNEPVLNEDSTVSISAKEDAVFTRGVKYAFRLRVGLKGSGESLLTKDIIIKPRQPALKLTATDKPVFYKYVNTGNNTRAVTIRVNNDKGRIQRIEWDAASNKKVPAGIAPIIEDGQLAGISFDGDGSIRPGKYKLTFNVYYEGQMWEKQTAGKASYEKPVKFRLTVTVK